ncbi:MAG TPA: DUF6790 family protein [Candidatus Binataceae bacterium]|nr:DUF6790 family protein [Candidatus Binataceae bacterium]
MDDLISFVLGNFTLTFLVIGLIASIVAITLSKVRTAPVVVEALFSYFLLFSIGFSFLYNFVVHVFFGEMAARLIGWRDSPFQAEVGFASLGFAVVGFLAFRPSFDLKLAAVIGPALFLIGAAGGHLYQMITAHNFAPGNAGVIFYTDILIPVVGFGLLSLQWHYDKSSQRDGG